MSSKTCFDSFRCLCLVGIITFCAVFGMACGDSGDNNNAGDNSASVQGVVQKGPLVKGSEVSIQQFDASLNPLGEVIYTETTDDSGGFIVTADITGEYFDVEATGNYFDEVSGEISADAITLHAIVDASESSFNINILTTLIYDRVKYLILNDGISFSDAQEQAGHELLNVFHIDDTPLKTQLADFYQMDITQDGIGDGILLAISIILQWNNSAADLSGLVTDIRSDFETDGTIENQEIIDEIKNNAADINSNTDGAIMQVRENLLSYYSNMEVTISSPSFEEFIITDTFAPIFNPCTGTYSAEDLVSLSSETADAVIYYTTDGSDPTHASQIYTAPIEISGNGTTRTIKAFAAKEGLEDSYVVTSRYTSDSNYDPSTYQQGLEVEDYQSHIKGSWVGYAETPWTYPYNVVISFGDSTYSAHSESQQYNYTGVTASDGEWIEGPVYTELWGPAFYYGSDDDNDSKIYEINSVDEDTGKASGTIVIFFFEGSETEGALKEVTFYNDYQNLSFEYWHLDQYGPVTFTLTRMTAD